MKIRNALALILVGILFIPLSSSFAQPRREIRIDITLDGKPTDAQVKAYRDGQLAKIAYTDVHRPGYARFQLQPGRYSLQIDHGGGFTAEATEVEVAVDRGDEPVALEIDLDQVYEPNQWGYFSADTHAHTAISPDGLTPVDQAVGVQLAADLDLVFVSDHNDVSGHARFAETARNRGVPFILSEEVTTDFSTVNMGHFNVYSLEPGALVDWRVPPKEIFRAAREKGAEVVQVNHPKSSPFNYFNLLDDPRFDPNFDAAEIYNGEFSTDDEQTVQQMFAFWNEGKRYVAVGVSDDHLWKTLRGEYGRPRTYVSVEGELTAENWIDALLEGHAFATYGPLIRLRANDRGRPGDSLTLAREEPLALEADILSVTALERVEVLRNGEVVHTMPLQGQEGTLSFRDLPEMDSWYAARVFAADGDRALTNPVWITVE